MATELTMPQMGYDMQEGTVVRWLKSEGSLVQIGEAIAEIETDKAVIEFESYAEGVLHKILVADGTTVSVGETIAIVGTKSEILAASAQSAPLISALSDSDFSLRKVSAATLGELGDGAAVQPLIRALTDSDEDVRIHAAESLGKLGDVSAVRPLVMALSDSVKEVRAQAARSLGKLEDDSAVQPLINALSDTDEDVRADAAWSLGQLRHVIAVPALSRLLSDSSELVRVNVTCALAALGDDSKTSLLAERIGVFDEQADFFGYEQLRTIVARSLGDLKARSAVHNLLIASEERGGEVREEAIRALGKIGNESALPRIISGLTDEAKAVRAVSAEAAAMLGGRSVLSEILPMLYDPELEVRLAAIKALADIGDASAIDHLNLMLNDKHPRIKRAASQAIERLQEGSTRATKTQVTEEPSKSVRLLVEIEPASEALVVDHYARLEGSIANLGEGTASNIRLVLSGPAVGDERQVDVMDQLGTEQTSRWHAPIQPTAAGSVPLMWQLTFSDAGETSHQLTGAEYIQVTQANESTGASSPAVHVEKLFQGPVVSGGDLVESGGIKQNEGVALVKGSNDDSNEPIQEATSFGFCPECGKEMKALKTPKFCPHCREQLTS
ncbi:MAG: HEAT repeat domain-containing protein [SAR202 cluster bacterium]|nr:HEAT repeat domain-containing protein [SAR202 cluster bacterium]